LISNHSNTLKEVFFFKMNKNDGKFHILTKNKKWNFCGGSHIHYVYQLTNYLVWHFQRRIFNSLANQKQELHVVWPCFLQGQDKIMIFLKWPHIHFFIPVNISFGLVFSEEKILKVSAKQKQELPMVVMFFAGSRQNNDFFFKLYQLTFYLDFYLQKTRFWKFQSIKIVIAHGSHVFFSDQDELRIFL
jgi:hypothetical protein